MKELINEYTIANTARMLAGANPASTPVLFEESNDADALSTLLGNYPLVLASTMQNLVRAAHILRRDRWNIVCAQVAEDNRHPVLKVGESPGEGLSTRVQLFDNLPEIFNRALQPLRRSCIFIFSDPASQKLSNVFQSKSFEGSNWPEENARRMGLIEKKYEKGLTQEEQTTLNSLQAMLSEKLNKHYPLPFEALEQLLHSIEGNKSEKK
jgi:hypothetical protein